MIIDEVKELGFMDNGTGKHQSNTVVDENGLAPTVTTVNGGGTQQIKVLTENVIIGGEQEHQAIKKDGVCTTLTSSMGTGGGYVPMVVSEQSIVRMIGRNPENPSDRTVGAPTKQRLEPNSQGICNTLTSVTKDNLVLEKNVAALRMVRTEEGKALRKQYENHEITHGFNEHRVAEPREDNCSNTLSTVPKDNMLLESTNLKYRIRKLTPRECWRLMAVSDEDFDKVKFKKEIFFLEGSEDKCNAKLMVANEKQTQENMETYVLCTTKDIQDTEILKTIWKQSVKTQEQERKVYVNFAIEKLEELVLLECATNTIKCIDFMGMHFFVIKKPEQQVTDIIARVKTGKQNTEKYMKIITESNLDQSKLYIILTLFVQIIESKIFTSTTLKVNIKGYIMPTTSCENSFLMMLSNLKMESIKERTSNSALYKQAGNSIVVNCLVAIFSQMGIQGIPRWNEGLSEKYK